MNVPGVFWVAVLPRQMASGGSAVWTRLSHMTGSLVTLYSDQAPTSGCCLGLSVVTVDGQKQTGPPGTDGPTRDQQTHNILPQKHVT